ncbi:hypothetical protein ABXN37_19800 [Piscinibacter sakaiensis]|nr:hypothetical protein [Piscinibacter sakaiensis]
MNTCPACAAAEQDPRTGLFTHGCRECTARNLAQSPAAHRALTGQGADDLRALIVETWGQADYLDGRTRVWAWVERLQKGK